MRKATTAVLLSALVLPGTGHLYLKRPWRGIALIAISLACLWVFVDDAMRRASNVLARLESDGGALDVGRLTDLIAQTSTGSDAAVVTAATLVLGGCWLVGIIDAYRLGKSMAPVR